MNTHRSQKLGVHLQKGTENIKGRITPNEAPTKVSDTTKQRVTNARAITGTAVQVSKTIMTGAMATAAALSKNISDGISKTSVGKKLNRKSGRKTKVAKKVGKHSLVAFGRMMEAVEQAGLTMLHNVNDSVVDVVGHKYGDEAKETTQEGLGVLTDAGKATVNLRRAGFRSVVKNTATMTASDVMSSKKEREKNREKRPQIDPVKGLQGLQALNQVAASIDPNDRELVEKNPKLDGLD